MKLAAEIELPFSEFWEMTPYELNLKAKAYFDKQRQRYEDNITLEYYNAMWTIQWLGKKAHHPKPLNKILDKLYRKKNEVMTDEEMEKRVRILNKMFGGAEI